MTNLSHQLSSEQGSGSIARKILFLILLGSSFVTLLVTLYQLYFDYREQVGMVDAQMEQIDRSYQESISNAIWFLNVKQVETILGGIMEFEDVHFVSVQIKDGDVFQRGERRTNKTTRSYDVRVLHNMQDREIHVGQLTIESNLDKVIARLGNKFGLILVSQGIKTLVVSFFILLIIYYLVARHLLSISNFAKFLDIDDKDKFLSLGRKKTGSFDELDEIVSAMNQMKQKLIQDALLQKDSEATLRKLSQAVEQSTASILILDDSRIIEYVNPRFELSTGYSAAEVLETQSDPLCFSGKSEAECQDIWAVISTGIEWRGETHSEKKDGTRFWESVSSSALVNTEGEITHYLILKDDISELKKLKDQLKLERDYLREEVKTIGQFGEIIGESAALRRTLGQVEAVATTTASVLILGESGVGKEMIARAVHTHSDRADKALVKVNCASIPNDLFESEFFGHVKGSFTGAHQDRTGRLQLADGGTLFLDEVGEIPISQQGKLLRALQEGEFERVGDNRTIEVDVRVVAATNRNFEKEIAEGRFREDLYYRLSVFPIDVPPLRQRIDDIVPLAMNFLEQICREFGREVFTLTNQHVALLKQHSWPGNIRELKNTIERAVISSRGNRLELESALIIKSGTDTVMAPAQSGAYLTDNEFRALEKANIMAALDAANWKTWGDLGAAALLGVKPNTLAYQIKKFGIKKP